MTASQRSTPPKPSRINECWAMDFMRDNLANGRKIRLLNVHDSSTKEYLGFEVDRSINGKRVCRVLDIALYGRKESRITVDNGPEFISNALDAWAFQHDVKLVFNKPGTPVDNAFIESFNGRVRDECLNMSWFLSLDHASAVIAEWKEDYNTMRPHSALGGLTPEEFLAQQTEYFQLQVAQ